MNRLRNTWKAIAAEVRERKGSVLVLSALSMIGLMGFTAFVVDIGYIAYSRAQLQNVTDGAALAAALELDMMGDQSAVATNATAAAQEVAAANPGGVVDLGVSGNPNPIQVIQPSDVQFGRQEYNTTTGKYDFFFGSSYQPYNIVKVTGKRMMRQGIPGASTADMRLALFFAPIIGHEYADIEVSSIASFQPRDVMLVIDLSASMNDDSELKSINKLGRTEVENNLQQIWGEMTASETMAEAIGDALTFTPDYVTFEGQPASGSVPHITVTLKSKTKIFVQSTKDLSNVVVQYSNGSTHKWDNLSVGTSSEFNASKTIVTCWVKSGNNSSGEGPGYGERFHIDTTTIQNALGLGSVSYPFRSGSWSSYFRYVQSSWQLNKAGYKYKYGGLTLCNYWLNSKPKNSQTDELWKASAQPVTALKDAVDLFVGYLQSVQAEDKVGLSVYNDVSQDAYLEHGLSDDLAQIMSTTRQRQAGHYDYYTNIGAGMRIAREELITNARPKALRMMILITDGIANRSSTSASAEQSALDEAQWAADNKIKILTISLGANADTDLMQQIADIAGGEHFNVPGGQSVSQYTQELQDHFGIIAADRPLKLIDEKYE